MKLFFLALLVLLLATVLFPRAVRRLFRRAGRSAGDLGRLGKELATGEEVEGSPLARYEVGAGEIVAAKLIAEHPLSGDRELQDEVAAIGARLAGHARRRKIPYRFAVVESDEPNAFAVPGGSIFITRPLVELCGRDPDRLAGVLGHEVVHVDRCHAVRNLAASMAATAGMNILTLGRGAILARLAGGIRELMTQGYRQDQELEADRLGVALARGAGYDPRGLLQLLEKLEERQPDGKGTIAELYAFFRSHPPTRERMRRLGEELERGANDERPDART